MVGKYWKCEVFFKLVIIKTSALVLRIKRREKNHTYCEDNAYSLLQISYNNCAFARIRYRGKNMLDGKLQKISGIVLFVHFVLFIVYMSMCYGISSLVWRGVVNMHVHICICKGVFSVGLQWWNLNECWVILVPWRRHHWVPKHWI